MYNRKDYEKLYEMYRKAGGNSSTDVGKNLAQLSRTEQQINTQYNQASDVLTDVRDKANIETLSLQDRIDKYLPQSLKQQGLDGLGVAQRYKENMSKAYDNQLARIGAEYDRQQEALYSNYRQATDPLYEGTKDEFGNKATDGYDDYYDAYQGFLVEQKDKEKVENYSKVQNEVYDMQKNGTDPREILNYLSKYKDEDFGSAKKKYDQLVEEFTKESKNIERSKRFYI